MLSRSEGRDLSQEVERATSTLVGRAFNEQEPNAREALRFLLSAIRGQPVPAWSDIDVCGIKLKVKTITVESSGRRLIFRQLEISDFEHESQPVLEPSRGHLASTPSCILRIELQTRRGWELQLEAKKVLTLLRLTHVCSVDFAQETHGTPSPFPILGGTAIIGTTRPAIVRRGRHEMILTGESEKKLQAFWDRVERCLPAEMYDFTKKQETPLSLAFERYCDGLFARAPIERKVAAAIMGLEALYLQRDGLQELSYRLSLRVSKVLSKLDIKPDEVRRNVKTGYRIRSLHVHGSHLSGRESKGVHKSGISPETLATRLLDYLRISLVHLICSGQDKKRFLDLVEESFVSRDKDDELGAVLRAEKDVLCTELP